MKTNVLYVVCSAILLSCGNFAEANSPPVVLDITGGVTPEAVYCPSTGGGCKTSWAEAERALRASTPDVGHLLRLTSEDSVGSTGILKYFHVPNQAPDSFGAALFGTAESVVGDNGHCPNSLATDNRRNDWGGYFCYSESEMIQGYIARQSARTSCGWNRCTYHSFTVTGDYAHPYEYVRGNWASQTGWMHWGYGHKGIRYIEEGITYPERFERLRSLVKLQPFKCPAGTTPFDTNDPSIFPDLCRSNIRPFIRISKPRQYESCPVNGNPCHPSSGDKSRAETDFVFAGRDFIRHYHSLREFTPGYKMADGWTHSFSMSLRVPGSSYAGINQGNGYFAPLAYMSANQYLVPMMDDALLQKLQDGSWSLTSKGGDVYNFTPGGVLTGIASSINPGNNIRFENDAKHRPMRIIDSAGRVLSLEYNSAGGLARAILPDGTFIQYSYDDNGNLASVDYGDGHVKHYHYGESGLVSNGDLGLLTGITSEDGRRFASFGYDIHGRVVLSTLFRADGDPVETTRIHYNSENQAQVTTSMGGMRTYTYSGIYRKPSSVSDSDGTISSTYDTYGRILSQTDVQGTQTRFKYTNQLLAEITTGFGTETQRSVNTDWDASLGVPIARRVLDANNLIVDQQSWTYNSRGQVLTSSQSVPNSAIFRETTTRYCEEADVIDGLCPREGHLLAEDGPREDVDDSVTYTYYLEDHASCLDAPVACPHRKGDLRKITNPLGQTTEILRYDGLGRPLSIIDPNGVVTDLRYNPRGWLASRTIRGASDAVESDDRITLFDYWPTGKLRRVTEPDGAWTEYHFDAAQRLIAISDNTGSAIDYTLDQAGNRIAEDTSDANGALRRTLSRVYDQLGRLVTQAESSANPTDYAYNAVGDIVAVTDSLGRVVAQAYDPLRRLVQTLQDVGGIEAGITYQYDALDQITRVIDPKGLVTAYTYGFPGELVQLDSPDSGLTSFTYDSAGNRVGQLDARGQATEYGYDPLNRLTSIRYAGAAGLDVSYVYDVVQPGCQAEESAAIGRLTAMVDASGGTQYCYNRFGDLVRKIQVTNGQALSLGYTYTPGGRLRAMTYPDGSTVDYLRDVQGRITEIGVTALGENREVLLSGATYAPFGPATGWSYGNGRSLLRQHDLDYRPQAISDPANDGLDLGFDYNPIGQLQTLHTADLSAPPRARFDHDSLGRLTAFRDGSSNIAIESYTYDSTGNRTSFSNAAGLQAYAYSIDSHRLTGAAGLARTHDAVGNTLTDGSLRSYFYNAANRLARVDQAGTARRHYVYNGRGERVRSHLGSDDIATVYDEGGRWLGDYTMDGVPKQQAIWLDDLPVGLLAQDALSRLHYIQADHVGTPRTVIDPVRNVAVWTWDLASEAFGNSPPNSDPDGDGTAFLLDLRFPGQRFDAASGLNYNYFRDYDTDVGRYAQSDPIGLKGGFATYGYANSNPTQYIDPRGLQPITCGNLRGAIGTIQCDGKGDYAVVNCAQGCLRQCTQRHEEQHIEDYIQRYGRSSCRGRAHGEVPNDETANPLDMMPYANFTAMSECRAWRASKSCAQSLIVSNCISPACREQATGLIRRADGWSARYRCSSYGW